MQPSINLSAVTKHNVNMMTADAVNAHRFLEQEDPDATQLQHNWWKMDIKF